ncbi:GNAT family N-acetyltransferase [Collimonas sp. OK607]|uniref:GNAT family N-acetyltransferase n=1 Tax=Collimonas sp. OK607 TaxID=1798194 RepID=UPI00147FF496|nr:GNAT family N-acetyltransferase [Collimonas sp. OK607]
MEVNLLHHEAWPTVFAPEAAPERDWDYWRACLLHDGALIMIADIDGQAAGMITAQISEETGSLVHPHKFFRIGSISVSVSHRGSGIGRSLMSAIEAWATSQGASDLRLTVWDFNQRAIAFYEELGYETRSHLMWKPLPTETAAAVASAFEFRPAHVDDAAAINALILQFLHEFTISADGSGAEQFLASVSTEAEARYISDPRYLYIAAFAGEVLAGFITIRDRCHISHLFVAPQFQRQGLATRLWQAALSSAPDLELEGFTVNSSPFALPVYERFGFVKTGPKIEKHGICFVPMYLSLG